jgi:DNA-binding beta-propeller fold protein YncE
VARLARIVAQPLRDWLDALESCVRTSGRASIAIIAVTLLAAWWLYVPLHELAHAWGCLLAGGGVTRLEIGEIYGAAWLARAFPYVTVGSEYAGRLSGFDTRGSDLIYLATCALPFVLTVFVGVPLLRAVPRARGRWRAIALGASIPMAFAPFVSLPGDYYEMGSILVSRAVSTVSPGFAVERWRSDDLVKLVSALSPQGDARDAAARVRDLLGRRRGRDRRTMSAEERWVSIGAALSSPSPTGEVTMTKPWVARLASLLGCLGAMLPAVPAGAVDVMFIANVNAHTVSVHSQTASGNTPPLGSIAGANTGLNSPASPLGPVLDVGRNELFVPTSFGLSVNVYQLPALGNVLPIRALGGPATGLTNPFAAALDLTNNELFVVNSSLPAILVYPRTASGNTAPLRTLSGAATGLNGPQAVALDLTNNELFVGNFDGGTVTVYSRTASGNTAPLRTLQTFGPGALALDLANNELFVANFFSNTVSVFSRTASGVTPPLRTLGGPATGLDRPRGLAINFARDELFVVNFANVGDLGTSTVTVFSRAASGNTAPLRTLAGPATGLSNSIGIALGDVAGPFVVAGAIPTLSVWASVVMAVILMGVAVTYLRRRRAWTI